MNTWVISDTHFGHENIIKYCNRPFKNAGHMDSVMRDRWFERVKPEDIIYHLGDVAHKSREDWIKELPGKKILVKGNHDRTCARMMELGFDYAAESIVITYHNKNLFLVHHPQAIKPIMAIQGKRDGIIIDYVLHGHIHNSTPEDRSYQINKGEIVNIPAFNINMSVELWNYEPATLDYILKKKAYELKVS